MEILLLGVYAFVVWLVFIKLKLLPWTTPWKVTVVIIPVVSLAALILLLNVFAPSTSDVRVIRYVVPIVSQVRGRVIDVPVENNRPVKKGDVLFRIDPTPYQNAVKSLEARLVADQAKQAADRQRLAEASANLTDARSGEEQLREQLNAALGQIATLQASLDLALKRVAQNQELTAAGAGSKFDLEQAQTSAQELQARLGAARAQAAEIRAKLDGRVDGELASVAAVRSQVASAEAQVAVSAAQVETTRADLDNARFDLTQTTIFAPADGIVVNVQLRPGTFVAGMPFNEVMTFVEHEYQLYAYYMQNELHQVKPGDHAELTLHTLPGRVLKAEVDSVLWAQRQGQMEASGNLLQTTIFPPPGRFAVKLNLDERDKDAFLAGGAAGEGAIYTEGLAPIHIIRKVLLRVGSYVNYLVLKLH